MPLSSEHRYYRQSLLPSLVEVAKYNFDRQQNKVNIFELANSYQIIDGEIKEKYLLSGLLSGMKVHNHDKGKEIFDFYDLKYVVEEVLESMGLNYEFRKPTIEFPEANQYAQACIFVDGERVGFIGAKTPTYYKKIKNKVFFFEIEVSKIEDKVISGFDYKQISANPVVERDLTILAKLDVDFSYIESVFENINYLIEKECSYIYEGDKIEAGMKAVTFKLKFLDEEKTLKGTEDDESVEAIIKNINDKKLEFKSLWKKR